MKTSFMIGIIFTVIIVVISGIVFGISETTFNSETNHPWDSGFLYENNTYVTSQKHEPSP
ncbi:hypothetical protein [Nitrosopumilus sp.]|uniref:hypothetical protein n=1 Tax=Nitrosopumilus sp. TaxID=2024843 RepID=UPI003B59D65B